MKPSLISVIIPTYNRSHLIGNTLDSIRAQTYKHWECLVIDDGSGDFTRELMEFYCDIDSRIKFFKRPDSRVKGANSCRNYGYELCKGEFINWFDSDDLMKENFLERKVAGFIDEVDMVISKSEFISYVGEFVRKENRTIITNNLLEDFVCLKVSWYLPDPMYRRKFLTGKKLFDENLFKGQDREFHIRRLLEVPLIIFIEEYLTRYRQSDVSISNDFSPAVIKSNYDAIKRQIAMVVSKSSSKRIQLYYIRDQIKKYPYLWNLLNFYKLFFPGIEIFKWFIKYNLAVVSYKLFGKGNLFLKG